MCVGTKRGIAQKLLEPVIVKYEIKYLFLVYANGYILQMLHHENHWTTSQFYTT